MIPPIPNIVFDTEDTPIRNNEPNSQNNDDETVSNIKVDESEALGKSITQAAKNIGSPVNINSEEKICHEKLPIKPKYHDHSAVDQCNIIEGSRIRKKTDKAMKLYPGALAATFNVFVIGRANPLQRLHQSEMPPPPESWNKLKSHPFSNGFRDAMSVEYKTLIEKKTIQSVKQTTNMKPIPLR